MRNSILCPNCKKLISRDEVICPYCHTSKPGSWVKNNQWTQAKNNPEKVIDAIFYINIGMFIFSLFLDLSSIHLSSNLLSFLSPSINSLYALGSTGVFPVLIQHRWWTLISAGFLHGGILHIFFNMMAFRQIAPFVLREFGSNRMIIIYLLTGIFGFVLSIFAGINNTIGASGSLCGLIGVIFFYGIHRGGIYGKAIARQVGSWMITLFLFGFIVPGINNWAHFGGIVSGFALGYLLKYNENKQETVFHKILAGGLVVITFLTLLLSVGSGLFQFIF